ncbi:multicopper oxidase domain-containing protein [Streptomyces aurantiogriseus]|uniref:multicopper oxidase domain-containing protein n=1 Tax=Streptomyces aurantiogriseus TaxID=66870 RepID=UPI001672D46C|nr:multicopper oxidase domain-containing protein [Streptomyces aurantiogriseus]
MISRRSLLKAGAGTAAVLAGGGVAAPLLSAGPAHAADLDPGTIPKYEVPMPRIPVLKPSRLTSGTSFFDVDMRESDVQILPGRKTRVLTYGGAFPGRTLLATTGRRTVVSRLNTLGTATSVHLHGAHVAPEHDGGPMDLIAPGDRRSYTYPNTQTHANLWFHDHAHHHESEHVYRGLSAFYLLSDRTERSLPLPSGEFDVPIMLRDARFDTDNQLVYVMDDFLNRNTILVNGRPWPYFQVAARKYRFRILNSTNLRFFTLKLSDGGSFTQIGSDGGLLAEPFETTELRLSCGERADIVVDFARYPVGTSLELVNDNGPGPAEHVGKVLRFDVVRTAADDSSVPARLRTLPALPTPTVERTIDLRMDEDGRPHPNAYIDEKLYDHHRVDTVIQHGTTELWTVRNVNELAPHNFHMHLVQFRVLERNGTPVTGGPEGGLKDTVTLLAGESVKLQATFKGYRGSYVYHCHMLDHSAMGMMATMQIV